MSVTSEQVFKDLKNEQYAPVYFLQGDEPFHIDQIAQYIETHALSESEKGFNQIVLYGKDTDLSTILTNAKRFPMMAARQVVLVKEAQELSDLQQKAGQEMLEQYVKNPLPSTVLVFCYKYKSLDKKRTLTKTLDQFAVLVESKKMYDNQVPDWIVRWVKARKHSIEEQAVRMLMDHIGNNLERLTNEIEKVIINLDKEPETMITADLVQKYVGISKEYNAFELQKAVAQGDFPKAFQIVYYFTSNPKANPIIPTIALLFTFFSKLLLIHQATDKTERGLAGLLKVHPFFVKEYRVAAVNYPLSKVVRNISLLRRADLHSKGIDNITGTDDQILKALVYQLMH
ncbi:MAG: DNA polymerase III subunit delta [Cyclobacteriaceae bacterium]